MKTYENIVDAINTILNSKENCVLGLDYVNRFSTSDEVKINSVIYGSEKYENVISKYLETHGSLLATSSFQRVHENMVNNPIQLDVRLDVRNNNINIANQNSTFKDLVFFLESDDIAFGKSIFWINSRSINSDIEVNISYFLILNCQVVDDDVLLKIFDVLLESTQQNGISTWLEDYNNQIVKNKFLEEFRDEVDSYSHNIFNILPDVINGLDNLAYNISASSSSGYSEVLSKEIKRIKLLEIFFRIIGKRNISEMEGFSYVDLLKFLVKMDPGYKECVLEILVDKDYIWSVIDREKHADVFNVIWNFWHNTRKYTSSKVFKFWVTFEGLESGLYLSFVNIGPRLSIKNINFLKGTEDMPDSQRGKKSGLYLAKKKVIELDWHITQVSSNYYDESLFKTVIKIQIR